MLDTLHLAPTRANVRGRETRCFMGATDSEQRWVVGLLAQQEDPTWAKLLGLVVDSREVTFSRGQDSQDSGRVWGPVEVQVDGGEEGGHVGGPHPVRQVWNQVDSDQT